MLWQSEYSNEISKWTREGRLRREVELAYRIGHHGRQRFGCMRRLVLIWKTSKCGMQPADWADQTGRADRQIDRLLITVYWFPVGNGEPTERADKRCANYCASLILAELKMCWNRRREWVELELSMTATVRVSVCVRMCVCVCMSCAVCFNFEIQAMRAECWEPYAPVWVSVFVCMCVCACGKQLVRLSWMKWAFPDEMPILRAKKKL